MKEGILSRKLIFIICSMFLLGCSNNDGEKTVSIDQANSVSEAEIAISSNVTDENIANSILYNDITVSENDAEPTENSERMMEESLSEEEFDYDSIYEEKEGVISLTENDEYIIPFDIVYANININEIKDWNTILRYERRHYEGKVYEFFNSDKIVEGTDFVHEGLLIVTEEDNIDNYQITEIELYMGDSHHDRIFYFEDVTYDGNKEILIDKGGYGAQGACHMDCYMYDNDKGMYVEIPGFSQISNPRLDSEQEYVFGSHRDSAFIHDRYAYQFMNGEFVLVYKLSSDSSGEETIWSINGEEIGRTDDKSGFEQIDNDIFNIFYLESGEINPRREEWFWTE